MEVWQIIVHAWRTLWRNRRIIWVVIPFQLLIGLLGVLDVEGRTWSVILLMWMLGLSLWAGLLAWAHKALTTSRRKAAWDAFPRGVQDQLLPFMGIWLMDVLGAIMIFLGLQWVVNTMLNGLAAIYLARRVVGAAAVVLLAVLLYVFVLVLWTAPLAVVVENHGVFAAMKRGIAVGRRVIGLLVSVATLLGLLSLPSLAAGWLIVLVDHGHPMPQSALWGSVCLNGVLASITTPLWSLVLVQVYQQGRLKLDQASVR